MGFDTIEINVLEFSETIYQNVRISVKLRHHFSSYGAFEQMMFENIFVVFINKHPVNDEIEALDKPISPTYKH